MRYPAGVTCWTALVTSAETGRSPESRQRAPPGGSPRREERRWRGWPGERPLRGSELGEEVRDMA
ncbi:hypothetical protein VM98_36540, partial [Streptomyces rubellomurinus subsp. indigoferus]